MRSKLRLFIALALGAISAAGSAQAAELAIADYSLVPDGTEIGSLENDTDSQITQLNTSSLGVPVVTAANPIAYLVTTFNFGTDTSADIYCNFLASGKQRRLGVTVSNAGLVRTFGSGVDYTVANLGPMAGQSVTVVAKFGYGAGSDTMALWVNPTVSSLEATPDGSLGWNSNNFYFLRQRIDNNSTPNTAGTSSITDTKILIGADATFAKALQLAAGVSPTGIVDADNSTVSASPTAVPADGTSTSTITVTLEDTVGVPVAGKVVSLAGDGDADITTGNNVSDVDGQVTFSVKSGSTGAQVFTATSDPAGDPVVINNTASVDFQAVTPVGPVDADTSSVVTSSGSTSANGTSTSTVTVTLRDSNGQLVVGEGVTLSVSPSGATISPSATLTTDANGQAVFTVSSSSIGAVVFSATSSTDNVPITQTAGIDFTDPLLAQTININFEQFTPRLGTLAVESELEGPAGGLGTEWNQLLNEAAAGNTFGPLVDSAGQPTNVTIQTTFTEGRSNATGSTPTPILASYATDFQVPVSRSVTLAGLQPGEIYDIWLIALRNDTAPLVGTWSTPNALNGASVQLLDNRIYGGNFDFEPGANYIVFRAVEPDPTGKIVLNVKGASLADGFDGDYRAGLGGIQISPGTILEPLEITDFTYSRNTDQIDVTWKSNPGESYGIYFSRDLTDFTQGPPAEIPAHASNAWTSLTSIPNPFPNADKLFVRIGPPDRVDPQLERVWSNGSSLTVVFSEQMREMLATDPANFTVRDSGNNIVSIASAAYGIAPTDIVLTPTSPLLLSESYTVTVNNLTDNAGRALSGTNVAATTTFDNNPSGVKVFILAGQSNMVGRGESEIGAGGVVGEIGSLRYMVNNDPTNYGELVDGGGNWISRSDVKIKWAASKGDHSIGFDGRAQFGPEFGAGQVLGNYYTEPVLIIKTAWGGKSLDVDFRSPRAVANRGGKTGFYYLEMVKAVHDALDDFDSEFPGLAGQGYQIAGFGWHQGINDLSPKGANDYEANMVDLILSIREEFAQPGLPVSIATTSHANNRSDLPITAPLQVAVINAQLAVADPAQHPEFAGTVFTTDTAPFLRDASDSPTADWTHWNNNGETLYLIGDAIGRGLAGKLAP